MNEAGDGLSPVRSPVAWTLVAAALSTAAVLGVTYLAVDRLHSSAADAVEHPGPAATDAQTEAEVVEQAKEIVAVGGLAQPTADYSLVSCKNRDDPPYQGVVYLNFVLPADVSADAYFRNVAAALVAHGWKEGLPPNQHLFGRNLSKDGVSALLYPDGPSSTRGAVHIHGRCRNTTDHRGDSAAWVDVIDHLH
jgi:hypothetical protein